MHLHSALGMLHPESFVDHLSRRVKGKNSLKSNAVLTPIPAPMDLSVVQATRVQQIVSLSFQDFNITAFAVLVKKETVVSMTGIAALVAVRIFVAFEYFLREML